MLTISKVFTILCLLCLCGNREYPGSFQNKLVSSSFKWVPKYILSLAKLKREGRLFWNRKALDWSYELSLTCGGNVNYYRSVYHPIPTRENREHPNNFQNKSICFQLNIQVYSLFGQTEGERKTFLGGCNKGGLHFEITPKSTWLP